MKAFAVILLFFALPISAHAKSYAVLQTDMGKIRMELLTKEAPKTVENFTKLVTGEMRWVEVDGKKSNRPFYDGLLFHRVHPEIGLFSGCPWGNGRGWPGYFIFDENSGGSKFERPGMVAMARIKGDNRVGSQFFITVKPQPRFDGKYTIFGEVVEGMDVVKKISGVDVNSMFRPSKPIRIVKIDLYQD